MITFYFFSFPRYSPTSPNGQNSHNANNPRFWDGNERNDDMEDNAIQTREINLQIEGINQRSNAAKIAENILAAENTQQQQH